MADVRLATVADVPAIEAAYARSWSGSGSWTSNPGPGGSTSGEGWAHVPEAAPVPTDLAALVTYRRPLPGTAQPTSTANDAS
jgi:hypothetical protein